MRRHRGMAKAKNVQALKLAHTTPPREDGYYLPPGPESPFKTPWDSPDRVDEMRHRRFRGDSIDSTSSAKSHGFRKSSGSSVIHHRRKSTANMGTPAAPLFVNNHTPETPSPLARVYGEEITKQREHHRTVSGLRLSVEEDSPLTRLSQDELRKLTRHTRPITFDEEPQVDGEAELSSLLAKLSQEGMYDETRDIHHPHGLRFDDEIDVHGTPFEEESYQLDAEADHDLVAASTVSEERHAWGKESEDDARAASAVTREQLDDMTSRLQEMENEEPPAKELEDLRLDNEG